MMYVMNMLPLNFSGFLLSAAACTLTNIFSSPYTYWFPIVVIAALAVIMVLILIAVMAPLIGRTNLITWARIKAYEEVATVLLAIIFLSFSSVICAINPVGALGSIGLVPSACPGSGGTPVNNLWGLSVCNMYIFNQHVTDVLLGVYWISFIADFTPTLSAEATFGGLGISFSGVSFSTNPNTIYLYPFFVLLFGEIMLSLLQVVLLSSSALLFSFLIGIGLIARAFGITRTFGNAMIALGIGIGFIYPLLVSVTYGFVNTTFSNILSALGTSATYLLQDLGFSALLTFLTGLFSSSTVVSFGTGVVAQVWNLLGLTVLLASMVGVGLIFIPLLNFVILDAFVVDFSSSLGQGMSFMELITGLV